MGALTSELAVKGMTCGGCEKSVANTIAAVSGVAHAQADRHQNKAVVTWKDGLDSARQSQALQEIRAALEMAGFECQAAR